MALSPGSGYMPGLADDTQLPMFDVQKVQMRFDISADFVAAQVANNVLVLALSTGRILRFDLDNPEDIDDIDLPKRPAEIGVIRKLFLDPSASHLLITTTLGENYYLHTQSRQPKALGKTPKGTQIESVAWNPSQPTASTREILLGTVDGSVYETFIEPSAEFYRSQEKYFRLVYSPQDGPVIGLHADVLSTRPETRRVLVATQHKLLHFVGRTGGRGYESNGSIYAKLFESEIPAVHEVDRAKAESPSCLAVSPDSPDAPAATSDGLSPERAYAWLSTPGIFHGDLKNSVPDLVSLSKQVFRESKTFPQSKLPPVQTAGGRSRVTQPPISSMILSQFHILTLVEGRLTAINRLDETVVYNQQILETGQANLGLFADHQKNTFWMFTPQEIYEIVVTDETRDVWKILLNQNQYDLAQQFAKTPSQKDSVASRTGEHLMSQGKFSEAATILGKSSKPFEDVALAFIDKNEQDALRKYLLVKLSTLKKSSIMQRMMLASWLLELFMAKLNQLDDTISTRAELTSSSTLSLETHLPQIRKDFQDFVSKSKSDLDKATAYEIIAAHGREEELLFYANTIQDYNYVLAYWINRERWPEAMTVLTKQTSPEIFYRYASVLILHSSVELIEVLTRQSTALDPKKLIPALLNYNKIAGSSVPLKDNQAVKYLRFCIDYNLSTEPAVHNTLIAMYASHPTPDESALLQYLKTQADHGYYDADFALRLCIAHKRVQSAVHIYAITEKFSEAVDLALKYGEVELAASVADSAISDPVLRKKLWLKVAKKVIGQAKGIKSAIEFLRRCELLRIEDLIPFFPDFVVIDDFKEEICVALEEYSRRIEELKKEMDASAETAGSIKRDIKGLEMRYAIVEAGERCWRCRLPLLMRQFFVFPCQHAFHADCLGEMVMGIAGMGKGKRIRELQREIGRGVVGKGKREGMVRELDGLVAGNCVLCSEMAVKMVDEPFIGVGDDREEWAL